MVKLVSQDHCRILVHLSNDLTGVASEFGVGSTFAFWVKAKRSSAPPEAEGLDRPAIRVASDATGRKIPSMVNAKAGDVVAKPIKVLVSCISPFQTRLLCMIPRFFCCSLGAADLTDSRS